MIDPPRTELRFDLCIIGGGSAGYSLALAAGLLGVPTVLIDKTDLGEPLPRALDLAWASLAAAARRAAVTRAARGGGYAAPATDWRALLAAVRVAVGAVAPDMSGGRLRAIGVSVIRGTARFRDPHRLEADGQSIAARRFVVATGARPAIPSVPGLDLVPLLTVETLLDLPALPQHLLILGGGETGCRLAQIFARLGAKVDIFDQGPLLGGIEPEFRAPVLARLAAEGVGLHPDVRIVGAEPLTAGVRLIVGRDEAQEIVEGSHLLIATGWKPSVAEWLPEAAGLALRDGRLVVGPGTRTSQPHIHAIGAVAGRGASPQAARSQTELVLRAALLRLPGRFHPERVARVTGTDPEIATVGLDEAAARAKAGRIRVLRWPYGETDRARAEGLHAGHIKVVATARGRVLGATIVGPEAREVIGLWTLAVTRGLKVGTVAALALPASGFSDLSRRAALSGIGRSLGNPWLHRLLALFRRFG